MRLCLLLMIFFLQGCADVAVSGAQAVYNRHSIQKNISDQYTTLQAYQALNSEGNTFKDTNIAISTYNNELLLAGQVPEAWQRSRAEEVIKRVTDVDEVHNLLAIASPSSALTRMSDTWITTKIKAKLIASEDADASQVKVITENGTVYLMGIVRPSEAQAVIDLASNTDGVRSVVKVFKYIRISRR